MNKKVLNENNIFTGNLILVNLDFPMHDEDKIDLVTVNDSEIRLQREAAESLNSLMNEIGGWAEIVPVSGFRSLAEQQIIWNDCLTESGIEFTRKYVAKPGHSEHQTGLAIDLGKKQKHIDFIRPEFPDDGVCGKFKSNAAKYGFILRYPSGKEHITKIGYEPWHFRYVGVPHAEIIEKNDFVLEEYIEFLKRFNYPNNPYIFKNHKRQFELFYLEAEKCSLDESAPFAISGNNSDGFILVTSKNLV